MKAQTNKRKKCGVKGRTVFLSAYAESVRYTRSHFFILKLFSEQTIGDRKWFTPAIMG